MASNGVLTAVPDRARLQGFGNLLRLENHRWWGTRKWILQILIWGLIINGLLAVMLISFNDAAAQARERAAEEALAQQEGAGAAPPEASPELDGVMIYFLFMGMAAGVGVAILGQEALVHERQSGTAAWVLSKPASRSAFILSRVAGNALGILGTMIVAQGVLAWVLFRAISGIALPMGGFAAGLGLAYLNLVFYLLLAIVLGTLFESRGPVIGITLLILFGFQIFTGLAPWLFSYMPWVLTMSLGNTLSYAALVVLGQPLPSLTPIVATLAWCLVFTVVALWRFSREEF